MAKKKKSKVSQEEINAVEGLIGAKVGLGLGAQMKLLKSKFLAVPVVIGSAAASMLSNKETDKKVKNAIQFVKESSMDKATIVFQKLSKCKTPGKKKMVKKAAVPALASTAIMLGIGFAPKPRKTVTGISSASGKDLKMKEMINLPKPK